MPEFAPDDMPVLEPLKVHCQDVRCDADLHCFSPNRRRKDWEKHYKGECMACGRQTVDWARARIGKEADPDVVFSELRREYIRTVFFEAPFDAAAKHEARNLGLAGLKTRVRPLLAKKIGPAHIFRDGTQTRKEGSALFYAQHATATCCRKCLDYWYNVERGRDLTDEELDRCEWLVLSYLDRRSAELFAEDVDGASRGRAGA